VENHRVFKVSELTTHIRSLLEDAYPFVRVAGEISNLSQPASGHLYFTLKDAQAQLRIVLFKMQRRYLAKELRNGMEVICLGRISVYEPRGEYQLIADTVDFQGAGALQRSFEALKARLAAEGLFDQEKKRPLPFVPKHITLLTSPQGAALYDFLRVARRRFPGLRISIYPVPVQGEQAAAAMVAGLERIRSQLAPDVLVLCRGGGSVEDLWAYNDEHLARAIRQGSVPVVSAVGHEIDFTIADFAADLRAPTPSAAAELLVPEQLALQRTVRMHGARLQRLMEQTLNHAQQQLQFARHRLRTKLHPVDTLLLRVDQLKSSLVQAFSRHLDTQGGHVAQLEQRLQLGSPRFRLIRQGQELADLEKRLVRAGTHILAQYEGRFLQAAAVLRAVSPLATLTRGYAIARKHDAAHTIIHAASQVDPGEKVELLLATGRLECRVEAVLPADTAFFPARNTKI
jgi:exodeoxyribonuclease VII large subunit